MKHGSAIATARYRSLFRQPEDAVGTTIWRYLKPPHFKWLIEQSALRLARINCFEDPLEGKIPFRSLECRRRFIEQKGVYDEQYWDEIDRDEENTTFANCWHQNVNESNEMWGDYCPQKVGAVVKSTYSKLEFECEAAGGPLILGCVDYVTDWTSADLYLGNTFPRFLLKDCRFYREQEARLLCGGDAGVEFLKMPVRLSIFVDEIRIHPAAPHNYFAEVEALLQRNAPELTSRLHPSCLKGIWPNDLNV